jgi:hypothetical protein
MRHERVWANEGIVERLVALRAGGLFSSLIARQLSQEFGVDVSRSAVIAKANRLGLPAVPPVPRPPRAAPTPRKVTVMLGDLELSISVRPLRKLVAA